MAHPTARAQFGQNLKRLRLRRKLSQERLAELAGLHRNYVGLLERGQQNVPLDTLVILARALKVRLSELLRGID